MPVNVPTRARNAANNAVWASFENPNTRATRNDERKPNAATRRAGVLSIIVAFVTQSHFEEKYPLMTVQIAVMNPVMVAVAVAIVEKSKLAGNPIQTLFVSGCAVSRKGTKRSAKTKREVSRIDNLRFIRNKDLMKNSKHCAISEAVFR